jgi:alkanesulfonate monooxygenase SsuD/methylene tetrahydromethanopterin reductase-like flavin-dependent oxidoreductase (luciferase family)
VSEEFRAGGPRRDGRMATGSASAVVEQLRALKAEAEVDEIVVVTPSLDRARRQASYRAIADAWRAVE